MGLFFKNHMIPLSHFDKRLGDALIPCMSARFLATTRMRWSGEMCDYSLHNVKTRPAKVGDKLITRQFHSGTTGFSAPEDASMAVCVLPGTELSFRDEVRRVRLWLWTKNTINNKTAIFRQINQDNPARETGITC